MLGEVLTRKTATTRLVAAWALDEQVEKGEIVSENSFYMQRAMQWLQVITLVFDKNEYKCSFFCQFSLSSRFKIMSELFEIFLIVIALKNTRCCVYRHRLPARVPVMAICNRMGS